MLVIKSLSTFLAIVLFFGCASLVYATDDPGKKLSEAREMLRLDQVFPADAMMREAIAGFSEQKDYRGLGEADLEYASFMQTRYIAHATSPSELEQVSFVQSKYLADAVSSFENALPALIASQDFWAVSKVYFQLAVARNRLYQTDAACAALSQSLESYREALVKDNHFVASFGETASDGSDEGDGMREVRSKFGCRN